MFEVISPLTQGSTSEAQRDFLPTEDFEIEMSPFDISRFQDMSKELHGDQAANFDEILMEGYNSNSQGMSLLDYTLAYTEGTA